MERTFTPIITELEVTNAKKLKPGDRAFGSNVFKIGEKNNRGNTAVYLCDSRLAGHCSECVKKTECPMVV